MMCCTAAAFLLAACQDDGKLDPSMVDKKDWDLDANMDVENYRPGDNFYMYCIGNWYANADLGGEESVGLFDDAEEQAAKLEAEALRASGLQQVYDHADRAGETEAQAEDVVKERFALVEQVTTKEEGWKLFAQLIAMGYDNVLSLEAISSEGEMCVLLNILSDWTPEDNGGEQWLADVYEDLGESPETARQKAADAIRVLQRLSDAASELHLSYEDLCAHPERQAELAALRRVRTRAAAGGFLQTLESTLGIDEEYLLISRDDVETLESIADWTLEELKALLEYSILMDYEYVSPAWAAAQVGEEMWDWVKTEVNIKYMGYPISYAYATRYVSPELKAEYQAICEEMRSVFRSRLENLDWMSATTKQNAIKKLDAMKFNVGYPDEWIEGAMPELTGSTFVEDVMQLREAYFHYLKGLAGQGVKEASFNFIIPIFTGTLPTVNCSYYPMLNCLCIYPAFMLEPLYRKDFSDAYNYALFGIVGHEITHGFDDFGSQYDEDGNFRNWWTVMDKMAFMEKCQSLIECYNLLEILPEEMPGVYCDGENTLGENIADLGGMEIAYQAYVEKLMREGFYGEELEKQERRFFQGWAEVWRTKYTTTYVNELLEDVHSFPKERVNGTVMNCDRWYELYDVQWGDLLYLSPELRTHIW